MDDYVSFRIEILVSHLATFDAILFLFLSGGRLLSSEDEEEDSDMDDFIDDTPYEGPEGGNVSSYIKEIFGYDSSK